MAKYFAGIDAFPELSSLCIVDELGNAVQEVMAASEPEAIIAVLHGLRLPISYVGLGAGLLSRWISDGLHKAGFQVMLLEEHSEDDTLPATTAMASQQDTCNFVHIASRKSAFDNARFLQKRLLLASCSVVLA